MSCDVLIVGGGLVGLATGYTLLQRCPELRVTILEKEAQVAAHQSGHNSGVIHSGIYYRPGSLKARLARAGARSMVAFCQQHAIPHEVCGKLIIATDAKELPQLRALFERGQANGIPVRWLDGAAVRELEPHAAALAGIHVATTGIVDYRQVALKLAERFSAAGGTLLLNAQLTRLIRTAGGYRAESTQGTWETRLLVNCAGLHSDRLARLAGSPPPARIVPFRGEYYQLRPEARRLVRHLIYPVPNPNFPFLGVHLTRAIDGSVHAGPNAVLALKREGYRKRDVSWRDARDTLSFPGFWRLALRYAGEGLAELYRSWVKAAFVRSVQRLVPAIGADDLLPAGAGVRAQALSRSGALVDDFLIVEAPGALHVCNAPSPAATASLEIGNVISDKILTAIDRSIRSAV